MSANVTWACTETLIRGNQTANLNEALSGVKLSWVWIKREANRDEKNDEHNNNKTTTRWWRKQHLFMRHGSIWNVQRKIRTLIHGHQAQSISLKRVQLVVWAKLQQQPAFKHKHNPYAHTGAHTAYSYIHTYTQSNTHTRMSVHTHILHTHSNISSSSNNNNTQSSSLHTLMIQQNSVVVFFPIQNRLMLILDWKPRFLLLFPPPSYIHSVFFSISFFHFTYVCVCVAMCECVWMCVSFYFLFSLPKRACLWNFVCARYFYIAFLSPSVLFFLSFPTSSSR